MEEAPSDQPSPAWIVWMRGLPTTVWLVIAVVVVIVLFALMQSGFRLE